MNRIGSLAVDAEGTMHGRDIKWWKFNYDKRALESFSCSPWSHRIDHSQLSSTSSSRRLVVHCPQFPRYEVCNSILKSLSSTLPQAEGKERLKVLDNNRVAIGNVFNFNCQRAPPIWCFLPTQLWSSHQSPLTSYHRRTYVPCSLFSLSLPTTLLSELINR